MWWSWTYPTKPHGRFYHIYPKAEAFNPLYSQIPSLKLTYSVKGFPGGSAVKNLPAMQATWIQSPGREDPLEKRMATHSSILAWRIPGTEEPGGLQSTGSPRVRHDLATYHTQYSIKFCCNPKINETQGTFTITYGHRQHSKKVKLPDAGIPSWGLTRQHTASWCQFSQCKQAAFSRSTWTTLFTFSVLNFGDFVV